MSTINTIVWDLIYFLFYFETVFYIWLFFYLHHNFVEILFFMAISNLYVIIMEMKQDVVSVTLSQLSVFCMPFYYSSLSFFFFKKS